MIHRTGQSNIEKQNINSMSVENHNRKLSDYLAVIKNTVRGFFLTTPDVSK